MKKVFVLSLLVLASAGMFAMNMTEEKDENSEEERTTDGFGSLIWVRHSVMLSHTIYTEDYSEKTITLLTANLSDGSSTFKSTVMKKSDNNRWMPPISVAPDEIICVLLEERLEHLLFH